MGWTGGGGGCNLGFVGLRQFHGAPSRLDLLDGVACAGVYLVANPPEPVCPLGPRLRGWASATTRPGERTGRSINAGFFAVSLVACPGNTVGSLMSEIVYWVASKPYSGLESGTYGVRPELLGVLLSTWGRSSVHSRTSRLSQPTARGPS